MLRRTKIIATIGPATEELNILKAIILAGVDIIRVNMSHGTTKDHIKWLKSIAQVGKEVNKEIGILVDLQGPKLRIAKFQNNAIELAPGDKFILDSNLAANAGNQLAVGIDYPNLPNDVTTGDILLFDDGRIIMEVSEVLPNQVHCIVQIGGILSNNKGFNKQGGGLSANAITDKDHHDILLAAEYNANYIGLSFTRSAQDILTVKAILNTTTCKAGVIAKIERIEAIAALTEIIEAADGVMVARGDLGVELGFAELPAIQKHIIQQALALDRAVITATQMMESMIQNPIPTRAEVSDVANAIIDGTDAVMLSGETAIGKYPIQAVESVVKVCLAVEKQKITQISQHRLASCFKRVDEAIAMATMYTANHLNVKAIVALTESGSTPLWMSRISSGIPIYGVSRHQHARGKMTLYRDVFPINFDVTSCQPWEMIKKVITTLQQQNIVQNGDKIIITRGHILGIIGHTDTMKIITIGSDQLETNQVIH